MSKAIDKAGGQSISWFGPWLRAERERRGISSHELAERGGFHGAVNHGGVVVNWETGLSIPSPDQFNRVCDILGLDYPRIEVLEREVFGMRKVHSGVAFTSDGAAELEVTAPATEAAKQWSGWNVAMKPAHEPIVLARKPLIGSVAQNVLKYGTGALNIAGCRVAHGDDLSRYDRSPTSGFKDGGIYGGGQPVLTPASSDGRWPPNVLLTHSADCVPLGTKRVRTSSHSQGEKNLGSGKVYGSEEAGSTYLPVKAAGMQHVGLDGTETVQAWDCAPDCPVAGLDGQSGRIKSGFPTARQRSGAGAEGNASAAYGAESRPAGSPMVGYGDAGGASRFYPQFAWDPEYDLPFLYNAKASKKERPELPDGYKHPTVKPLSLLSWLVRLVTPPGGLVLDPFAGTGTTGLAALGNGMRFTMADNDTRHIELCKIRLKDFADDVGYWRLTPESVPQV